MSKRKCVRCGKDPAEGYANYWTAETGTVWYCHGDDDESPTCYERAAVDAYEAALRWGREDFYAGRSTNPYVGGGE